MNYLIVQLSADEAVFARFRQKGKGLVFIEASRGSVDADHPFASLLPEIKMGGGAEEKVVLALPPALFFMREIELPVTDLRKVREVLPLEMRGETAIDTDELVFDALPLGGGKFLAVWVKKEKVAEAIRVMTEQGMEPEIVTASLFHWGSLIPDNESAAPVALTDGEAVTVYSDGVPVSYRPMDQRALVTEAGRTLAALEMTRGIKVEMVYLHGSASREAASVARDETSQGIAFTPLPVRGELAVTFPADPVAARDLAGAYALARGCRSKDPLNFRRGDLAYTAGFARARRKFRLSLCLAAAAALLLFAEVGLRYYLVTRDLNSLNSSITSIYRDVFPTRKKAVDEVAELRSEIKRLSGTAPGPSLLPLLKKLAELKGDDIAGVYETEVEGGQVRLKGDARSVQGVNDFKVRGAAVFSNGEVGEIKSRPDGSVSFAFRATIQEEAK